MPQVGSPKPSPTKSGSGDTYEINQQDYLEMILAAVTRYQQAGYQVDVYPFPERSGTVLFFPGVSYRKSTGRLAADDPSIP